MHYACVSNSLGVVECLLQPARDGKDANYLALFVADENGHTCLHLACGAGDVARGSRADASVLDDLDQDLDEENEDEKNERAMMEEGPDEFESLGMTSFEVGVHV